MSFFKPSKPLLLTSLTCFTLGFSSTIYIGSNDDASNTCCTSKSPSSLCGLPGAVNCFNEPSRNVTDIVFKVGNTNRLSDSPNAFSRVAAVNIKTDEKTTLLGGDSVITVLEASGATVVLGPSTSSGTILFGNTLETFPPNISASGGTLVLGPQVIYPDNYQLANVYLSNDGTLELAPSGNDTLTLQTRLTRQDLNSPTVYVNANIAIKVPAITADNGILSGGTFNVKGNGLDSTLYCTADNANDLAISNLTVTNGTFASDRDLGNTTGTITLNDGAFSFRDTFTLTDSQDMVLANTGYIDVAANLTGTIDCSITGTGILEKRGLGTLLLTNNNEYTGGTVIVTGTLSISNPNQINQDVVGAGTLLITDNGTLEITNDMTLRGATSLTGGTLAITGYDVRFTTSLTMNAESEIEATDGLSGIIVDGALTVRDLPIFPVFSGKSLVVSGGLAGDGILNLAGGASQGVFALSGAGSFSGTLNLNGMTLALNDTESLGMGTSIHLLSNTQGVNSNLSLNGSTNHFVFSDVSGNASSTIVNNAGSFTAALTSSQNIRSTISGTGDMIYAFSQDATAIVSGTNTYTGATWIKDKSTVVISSDDNLGNGGDLNLFTGGTLSITESITLDRGVTLYDGTGLIVSDEEITISGKITERAGVTGLLHLKGGGAFTLSSISNDYTGGTTVEGSTLIVTSSGQVGTAASTLILKDGDDKLNSVLSVKGDTILFNDLLLGGDSVFSVDSGKELALEGDITGSNGITLFGLGITVFKGNNTYSGDTILERGTLQVGLGGSLGTGTLIFDGNTPPLLKVSDDLTSASNLSIKSGGAEIRVDAGFTAAFTGDVLIEFGPPSFKKSGEGTLSILPSTPLQLPMLTVEVAAGTLVGNTNYLKYASITLSDEDAVFTFSEALEGSFYGSDSGLTIVGQGSLAIDGAGTLNLLVPISTAQTQRANTYRGGTILTNGTVAISSDGAFGNSNGGVTCDGGKLKVVVVTGASSNTVTTSRVFTLNANTTFDIDENATYIIDSVIKGSGGLTKDGPGILALGAPNIYTGVTAISRGTLNIENSNALSQSSSIIINNGVLAVGGGPDTTVLTQNASVGSDGAEILVQVGSPLVFSGDISGSGVLTLNTDQLNTITGVISVTNDVVFSGIGTNSLKGVNTYTGSSILDSGTLLIENDNNLGPGTLVFRGGAVSPTLQISEDLSSTRNILILGNGEIQVTSNVDVSFTGDFSISSAVKTPVFIKSGSGNLSFLPTTASTNQQMSLIISDGNMTGNTNFLAESSISIPSGSTFTFSETGTGTYTGTDAGDTISGAGALAITGAGTLNLFADNTFTGGATLAAGTTVIKTAGALGTGNITFTGGSLQAADTLELTRDLTLSSDTTFSANSNVTLTLSGILSSTGALTKIGEGTVALMGSNTYAGATLISAGTLAASKEGALSTGTVTIDGATLRSIVITEGGSNAFTLDNPIVLASGATINTDANTILTLSGVVSGSGGLTKTGDGVLAITQVPTYGGSTEVKDGALTVNSTVTTNIMVDSGALLNGTGKIIGDVTLRGYGAAGNSIGDLEVTGAYTFATNSSYFLELNASESSVLTIGAGSAIEDNVSLVVVPNPDVYDRVTTLEFIQAPSGYTGEFTTSSVLPIFYLTVSIDYTDTAIALEVTPVRVAPLATFPNTIAVANALDGVVAWNRANVALTIPIGDSAGTGLLSDVLESLLPLDTTTLMDAALDQLHPAALKGLVIAQENASIQVQGALSTRMTQEIDTLDCSKVKRDYTVWINGMGDTLNQESNTYKANPEVGYQSSMTGFVAGADYRFIDLLYAGVLGGYTSSHVSFKEQRGSGDIGTGYLGVYLSAVHKWVYGSLAVTGGLNGYSANRNIKYSNIDLIAENSHGGCQLLSHAELGINLPAWKFNIRPFDRFDYLTQKEYAYTEKKAGEWNLHVKKNTSILIRNELGLQFASCFPFNGGKISLLPKFSWIREIRVKGSTYAATFSDAGSFPFTVEGYFPDRNLFSPGVILTGDMLEDRLSLSAYYDGEFTGGYSAHRYGGEIRYSF